MAHYFYGFNVQLDQRQFANEAPHAESLRPESAPASQDLGRIERLLLFPAGEQAHTLFGRLYDLSSSFLTSAPAEIYQPPPIQ